MNLVLKYRIIIIQKICLWLSKFRHKRTLFKDHSLIKENTYILCREELNEHIGNGHKERPVSEHKLQGQSCCHK